MKIVKKLVSGLFWLLIIALLVAPLGLIYQISADEMEAYQTPETPVLRETSMGEACQAMRIDLRESVRVSGKFVSASYAYMELDQRTPSSIRWLVTTGDEIQEGQTLGTYKGEPVVSTVTGILEEMNTYSTDAYLRVQLLTPVELSCSVNDRTLSLLKHADALTTEKDEAVTLSYVSLQKNADGTTNIRLSIETDRFIFGQELEKLAIYTGRVYNGTLVLPEDCVYQKEDQEDAPWYVRQVTEDGFLIGEQEVQVGYSDGEYVCVTGVEEGAWFDSGYKAIAGG